MAGTSHLNGSLTEYRALMAAFPTGVAVVTAIAADGLPRGLTCTSLASVTLEPPTLLVCLNLRSGTLRAIETNGVFAVNLLHAGAQRAAEVFSTPVPDRFERVAWQPHGSAGVPRLVDDAFALAECRLIDAQQIGDHAIVLGEVASVAHTPAVPLLYGERQFSAWLPDALVRMGAE